MTIEFKVTAGDSNTWPCEAPRKAGRNCSSSVQNDAPSLIDRNLDRQKERADHALAEINGRSSSQAIHGLRSIS
jgi:hypothetical protein